MIPQVLTAVAATLASSAPPNLPGFLNVVAPYLEHYSYGAVFLLVMLEDFGIPVPGETILIAAAIFAGAGRLNIVLVGLVGFLAAIIGDNIGFLIGHFGGRALALRWGRYVGLTEERLTRAETFFEHRGARIIIVARFIEGLRQANGIIAGLSGMHWRRFLIFNAIGAALWVGTWVSLGYLAGNHIATIYHYITEYSLYVLIALAVLVVALIVRHVVRRRRRATRGVQEKPEVIGQHEAQEATGAQEAAGTQENVATGEGAGTGETAGVQDSAEADDGAEAPDKTEAYDSPEAPDKTEAHDSPEAHERTAPDKTEGQDGTGMPNGTGVQEGARTQSS